MSCSKYAYDPDRCDGRWCIGDCWWCKYNPEHDGEVDDRRDYDDDEPVRPMP